MKINIILAAIAFIAGISAVFTRHADRNGLYPSWKYRSERSGGEKIRLISPDYLADLIYHKEEGWIIVDARNPREYEEYHIPGAIPYTDEDLFSALNSYGKVILYGKKDNSCRPEIHGKVSGKIFHLDGGMEEWYRIVLFPDFNTLQVRNTQTLEEILRRCSYFGGRPQNTELLNISKRSNRFREGC